MNIHHVEISFPFRETGGFPLNLQDTPIFDSTKNHGIPPNESIAGDHCLYGISSKVFNCASSKTGCTKVAHVLDVDQAQRHKLVGKVSRKTRSLPS